jgi:hypothetical protein
MLPCSSELNRSWLEVRIVDDKTGEPIAAAVVITDGDGKAVEIEGKHPHVGYLGKRRCYVDGAFSLAARATPLTIELRHGQGWGGTNGSESHHPLVFQFR